MIKIINGQPVSYSDAAFRAANKNTVYDAVLDDRHLNAQDVYRVVVLPEPKEAGKIAVKDDTPVPVNGEWVSGWTLQVKDADALRDERDAELRATDWQAVSDRTMTGAEIAYRQALRDLPQQAGFPKTHTWPNKT